MPARRETPAEKTARDNIATLIATHEITDPDLLAHHNKWRQHPDLKPTQIRLSELGAAVGMSESQLSKKLDGVHAFRLDELKALAKFFGVTLDDITNEKKTRKKAGAS